MGHKGVSWQNKAPGGRGRDYCSRSCDNGLLPVILPNSAPIASLLGSFDMLNLALITLIRGNSLHYGKNYCYPSQKRLTELYHDFTGQIMSRRSLNRHLKALETTGWLTRQRRHKRNALGQLELHSTLYRLTRRAYRWLESFSSGFSAVTQSAQKYIHKYNNNGRAGLKATASALTDIRKWKKSDPGIARTSIDILKRGLLW